MAFTATDLAAIQSAIASGALVVQFADRTITYRSIDDLLKAERRIAAALAGRSPQILAVASKGFDGVTNETTSF